MMAAPLGQPTLLPGATFSFDAPPPRTASLGRRTAAYLIDFVLLGVGLIILAVAAAVVSLLQPGDVSAERLGAALLPVFLLALPLFLGYFTVLEAWGGRTLGKAALGLRVVRLDGSKATLFDSFVRNLLRLLWGPSLPSIALLVAGNLLLLVLGLEPIIDVLAVIGLVFLVLDLWLLRATEMEQRLGDLAVGTIVIEE